MSVKKVNLPHNPNPKESDVSGYSSRGGKPILFQVLSPSMEPIFNVLLALHVNPDSFSEQMNKSQNIVMTYGGYVEFVWPDELGTISASGSSGAFISPSGGLASGGSQNTSDSSADGSRGTMARERAEDLIELFRSNGCVYNSRGQPVIRGKIMCIYDRGVYLGYFTTFEVNEEDMKPFTIDLSWEFKVEKTIYKIPGG